MNEELEPLPPDISEKLAALVPPPMPPSLADQLLPGIHAAAAGAVGAGVAAAVPWYLARLPAWVSIATFVAGGLGGAAIGHLLGTAAPVSIVQVPVEPRPAEPEAAPVTPALPPPAPVARAPKPRAVTPPAPPPTRAPADSLREERVLIEAARAAIGRHPEDGLAAIEQHERAFPKGQLSEEREALAVQLLLRVGRRAEARARFERFTRTFPASPLASVLGPLFSSNDGGR